ncbi:uncharacterized protein BKA55DRAFT_580234 [Fusarium redolens]|uniref:Uncharacterized protein n=1 Tax=Fusarium redolens TaxID=48865 RepID=A0A9P9G891_FUSRE|nr:uncharacterized protein BKA55DRAFT_580234 [Fusarium redolens]KAH7233822.1 hypothetical protein BKA55DRAFT_580234 [Fusarium redolens]
MAHVLWALLFRHLELSGDLLWARRCVGDGSMIRIWIVIGSATRWIRGNRFCGLG